MKEIRLIALDVDGVLTDGKLYFGEHGEMAKAFHVFDGMGISLARKSGIKIAVITGRYSPMVQKRAEELHIEYIYQGIGEKLSVFVNICQEMGICLEEAAYIGDDLNDLGCIVQAGFGACPANACAEVKAAAEYCSPLYGGEGAVRDIIEKILKENGTWNALVAAYGAGRMQTEQ